MKAKLTGQAAVVTGAAGGIGKGIAQVLLENGAKVVIADIQDERGEETARELSAVGTCRFIHADVSSRTQVENLVEGTLQAFGRIDILVNNAGINIGPERTEIDKFPEVMWDKILQVDLTGVFYCCQVVSRVMIEQRAGRIVNIGSALGEVPARKQIAFIAAKGGLHHMTKGLALELGPYGINVNAVAPGSIALEHNLFSRPDSALAELRERMLSHVPLGRFGTVQDIARAVLFLCGEESSYITGHVLTVDGGWTCGYARDF